MTLPARDEAILDFRDDLRDAILREAGEKAVTFLGGATGLYYGYLDLIAWDLPAVLDAAQVFFERSSLPYAYFHVFRRNVGAVRLWEQETEPEADPETGSLLSAADMETLEAFDEGISGYFGKMLCWLEAFVERGVEEGKFTQRQARQDLQIALWYSFACNNLDEYYYYYKAADWMKRLTMRSRASKRSRIIPGSGCRRAVVGTGSPRWQSGPPEPGRYGTGGRVLVWH